MRLILKVLLFGALGLLAAACAPAAHITAVTGLEPIAEADTSQAAARINTADMRPRFLNSFAEW